MAKHIDNINRTGVQKKGSTAKSIGIAVAAILGIIVIYCALLVGSVAGEETSHPSGIHRPIGQCRFRHDFRFACFGR